MNAEIGIMGSKQLLDYAVQRPQLSLRIPFTYTEITEGYWVKNLAISKTNFKPISLP